MTKSRFEKLAGILKNTLYYGNLTEEEVAKKEPREIKELRDKMFDPYTHIHRYSNDVYSFVTKIEELRNGSLLEASIYRALSDMGMTYVIDPFFNIILCLDQLTPTEKRENGFVFNTKPNSIKMEIRILSLNLFLNYANL
jgi:hypothetical protein